MRNALLIRDGDPWWLSPDIWTVPGTDPNGSTAIPAVGQSTFVWARLQNRGEEQLQNVQLNFYWSNPATGVYRSNSTLIGSAFATVPGGETREVLCLTPWVPEGVNNGHECLVVEAIHPSDPLPAPLPDPFSPPTYDQVAQRNIDLVSMATGMMRSMAIQVATPKRIHRTAILRVEAGREPLADEIVAAIGLGKAKFSPGQGFVVGFGPGPELDCDGFDPTQELKLELKPGTRTTAHLQILAKKADPGRYEWLSVIEYDAETQEVVGGVSFVLTGKEGK